jgi:hypothetical protein
MPHQNSKPAQIKRLRIGANVVLQIAIFAIIVLMINYLAFNRYARWDFSRGNKYSLSEQTKKLLGSLKKEIKIYVFFSPTTQNTGAELYGDIQNLLKEYQFAAKKKIQVETIDPYRDLTRARELQVRFNFGARENLIILESGDRKKFVQVADMAEYEPPGMFGETPRVKAFRGEQELTSALLQLTEDKETKIGVVTGHGEPALDQDASLTRFKQYVQRQNIKLDALTLANQQAISTDYAAIIVIGPRYDLTDRDLSLLRNYWNEQGRLLICLDPKFKTPKLDQFLAEFGVHADNDVIVSQEKTGIEEQSQTIEIDGQFEAETGFLRPLSQVTGLFPGGTRSLAIDATAAARMGIVATKALVPGESDYWGEMDDILHSQTTAVYNQGVDLPPPLTFGIALERGAIKDARVQVRTSSRILVIGNADFVRDEVLAQSPADVDFILLSINWLADREKLLAIAPKEPRSFTLSLSDAQMNRIVLLTVGGIPLLVGLLGTGIWMIRRR